MRFRRRFFAALFILVASSCLAPAAGSDTTRLDVPFKTSPQGPLKLDLHYPEAPQPGAKYPLVVFTHGGGWSAGDKTISGRGPRFHGVSALTSQGFCVASVGYRLCSKDTDIRIRDCITDAKDALRFLAKNADQFSVDPNQVFTFGDSAGGQLAQMVLLSPPESFPGDPSLADAKYRLVAGVSWYGPCDFEKIDLFNGPGKTGVRDRFGARIISAKTEAKDKLAAYREVSPVNYLTAESRPLLMMQGDMDTTIPVHHAHYMKQRAGEVNAPVETMIVKNAGHGWKPAGGPISLGIEEISIKTADFLKAHLD